MIAEEIADIRMLARALDETIYRCLLCAMSDPTRDDYWRNHADMLERKFTTKHGRHYSHFLQTRNVFV